MPLVLFHCNWLRCYYDEPVLWIIFSIKFWFVGYLDRWASRFILSRLVECVCIHEYDSEFNWEYDLNLILVLLNEIDAIMMHTPLNSSFNFFGLWISMMCTDVLKAGGKRSGSTKYERRFRAAHICFTSSSSCQVPSLHRKPWRASLNFSLLNSNTQPCGVIVYMCENIVGCAYGELLGIVL